MFTVALFGCCAKVVMMGVRVYSVEIGYVSISCDEATAMTVNNSRCV